MTSNTKEVLPTIRVRKFHHRGAWQIGFQHQYSRYLYQSLKALEGAKYSRTHKCIYISYTQTAFQEFKSLQLKHIIIQSPDHHIRTRQSPPKSEISVITHSGPMNEGGKLDADIQSTFGLKKIIWQDNHFFIKINYSKEETEFLKSLYGSYWNANQRQWVCKGSYDNCVALQERYQYWDAATFSKLRQKSRDYGKEAKVIIKAITGDLSKLEVKINHAPQAVEWIKKISLRQYDYKSNSWQIPRDKKIVARFIAQCKEAKYLVHEMLSWKVKVPIAKSRNSEKWLKVVLKGVPAHQLELMQSYAKVFIRENYSYQTMKQYCTSFRRYLFALDNLESINDRTLSDIESYLNDIAIQDVSYQEVNRHISAIKFYYEKLGGWSSMKISQVKRPKSPKNLPYIFSTGEVKLLFSQLTNAKHKCMLFLAYGCGLRSGEVVSLQIRDIMLDRNQIFIRGGKGKKDRVVMVPKSIIPILQLYVKEHRPDNWLFPGQDRQKPYSRSSLRNVFKSALQKAGLDRRHKLHNLRHSFATHLMETGTQQRLIQKLLGHTSSKTTEIYTHISRGSITQVVSPLDKLVDE